MGRDDLLAKAKEWLTSYDTEGYSNGDDEADKYLNERAEKVVEFIESHMRAVIGTDERHTKKCREYANTQQIEKFCICTARVRNQLREEQRGVIL